MTQREVVFPVSTDVARDRLKSGLVTESKVRLDGENIEYEYVMTTNYFGLNHFHYRVAGRLQTNPNGSILRMTVTQVRQLGTKSSLVKILLFGLGCLSIPVGLVLTGHATTVDAIWVTVLLTVFLGALSACGYLCGSWFGREMAASQAARQLQSIVDAEPRVTGSEKRLD